jgi:hypothetical protein
MTGLDQQWWYKARGLFLAVLVVTVVVVIWLAWLAISLEEE